MKEPATRPEKTERRTLAELGAAIRAKREERGLTLDDITDVTHIRQNFLQGIESGDFSGFKALVYARGFVRTYAKLLDAPELWDEFSAQLTPENFVPADARQSAKPHRAETPSRLSMQMPSSARAGMGVTQPARGFRQSSTRRNVIMLLVLLIIASAAALLLNWDRIQSEIASVQSRQAYDSVKTREAEEAKREEQKRAEEEAAELEAKAQAETPEPEAEPEPEPEPEPAPPPPPELTIRATGDCWLRVTRGDEKLFEGVVKSGWERTFPLDSELTARYGRGQSVRVSTNGSDFTSPGTGVQRYRYTPDGAAHKIARQ